MLSGSGSFHLPRTSGSRTDRGGYETDYPVAGKVGAKAMYPGVPGGFPGSSRTPGTVRDGSGNSRPGPYLGPPELTERAGSRKA